MNIIFSHCTQSYPLRFSASNTKADFLARGLASAGAKVTFINGIEGSVDGSDRVVEHHGFKCYLFSRKGNAVIRLIRNFSKLISLLLQLREKGDTNVLWVGGRMPIFLSQLFVAKCLGYKCVWLAQEWEPAVFNNTVVQRFSSYVSSNWYGRFLDAICPISHFLWKKYECFGKPMHIIPVLADFNLQKRDNAKIGNHFTYCAGASYYFVLEMLLEAYKLFVEQGGEQKLVLILYGSQSNMERAKSRIESMEMGEKIVLKQQISDMELMSIFSSSLGLLIPLDPNSVGDQARFSQKIAEYVATKRPIITSDVGEIPFYFSKNKNAMVIEYSSKAYADAMLFLANNPNDADRIGFGGFEVGKQYFDFRINGKETYKFLKEKL